MRMPMNPGEPGRTYRSPGTLWAAIGVTAGGLVFVAVAAASSSGRVAGAVIAAIALLVAWRIWVSGIRVDDRGVTIGTTLSSRRFAWSEVDRFTVMPLGRYPYVGYVVLRDGRKFGTFGLSSSVRRSEKNRLQVQGRIDELNRLLAGRRGVPAVDA